MSRDLWLGMMIGVGAATLWIAGWTEVWERHKRKRERPVDQQEET